MTKLGFEPRHYECKHSLNLSVRKSSNDTTIFIGATGIDTRLEWVEEPGVLWVQGSMFKYFLKIYLNLSTYLSEYVCMHVGMCI